MKNDLTGCELLDRAICLDCGHEIRPSKSMPNCYHCGSVEHYIITDRYVFDILLKSKYNIRISFSVEKPKWSDKSKIVIEIWENNNRLGYVYSNCWDWNFIAPYPKEVFHNQIEIEEIRKKLKQKPERFKILLRILNLSRCKETDYGYMIYQYGDVFGHLPQIDSDGIMLETEQQKLNIQLIKPTPTIQPEVNNPKLLL